MKKIFALCMSAALLLQTCPVAFAASTSTPITVEAIVTEKIWNGETQAGSAGKKATVKYESITAAMEDLSDGSVMDAKGVVCKLDGAKPCKIYIEQNPTNSEAYVEQIFEKVIISADSIETAEVSDSEITLHFQDIEIAVDTGKQAVQNAITFSGGLEVQSGASLTLGNNVNISQHIINYTFGSDVVVAGELTFDGNMNHDSSVIFSEGAALTVQETGTASIGHVKVSGGSDEQPLITVAEGGTLNVSAPDMGSEGGTIEAAGTAIQNNGGTLNLGSGTIKSTSNDSSVPVISSNGGEVNLKITQETDSQIPPTMSVEGAPAISVTGDATLTVEEGNISNTTGAPAVTVGEGATVVIPEGSSAKIESTGEGSDNNAAITLAPGATIEKGGAAPVTVGGSEGDDPASNYMDNHGNIVLQSGSEDGKVAPNTVITQDGTAISGKNDLPTVEDDGSVTLPSGGATVTTPDGDKVEVDDTKVPDIAIGVEENGVVVTSKTVTEGDAPLELEAVSLGSINLTNYTCTVKSNEETVATAELNEEGKIVVTPVGPGTTTITATYKETSDVPETLALLDEGEATPEDALIAKFTIVVEEKSSGGGSSSSTTYAVSVEDSKNGSVSVSPKRAEKGDTMTITVKPDTGYELDELTVTDKNGDKIKLTEKDDNKFTFKMPGSKVTVEASFNLIEVEPENPFTDISKSDYFYDAVLWAADKGITSGVTDTLFAPNSSCTRAQMVTFLWRANGSPVVDYAMKFTDVPADAYYADAVRWAVSEGITSGTSATTFTPDMTVTRAQTVTFLYRAAGTPAVSGGSFADVDANAYYADAVAWAVSEGITSGTSATTFSPDAACTRGQIVTFMYRDAQ